MTNVGIMEEYDDVELENLYQWIDRLPLTRKKTNIAKDFSDGVLMAEIIKHYFPRMVDLHNYTPAFSYKQKMENWYLLNRKVLCRLNLDLSDDVMRALAKGKTKVLQQILIFLRIQMDKALETTTSQKYSDKHPQQTFNKVVSPSYSSTQEIMAVSTSPTNAIAHYNSNRVSSSRAEYTQTVYLPPLDQNVAKSFLDEKKLESEAKEETIRILCAKLAKLEHLLYLKNLHIKDLESCLKHTVKVHGVTGKTRII